jgi:hypothetical protein
VPKKEEEFDFETLDYRAQEAIIDLLVSIIRNSNKENKEEK